MVWHFRYFLYFLLHGQFASTLRPQSVRCVTAALNNNLHRPVSNSLSAMAEITNTLFPPPPGYYKAFTPEAIERAAAASADGGAGEDDPEVEALQPPRADWVLEDGRWMLFGQMYTVSVDDCRDLRAPSAPPLNPGRTTYPIRQGPWSPAYSRRSSRAGPGSAPHASPLLPAHSTRLYRRTDDHGKNPCRAGRREAAARGRPVHPAPE